jgi:hypothetical protein
MGFGEPIAIGTAAAMHAVSFRIAGLTSAWRSSSATKDIITVIQCVEFWAFAFPGDSPARFPLRTLGAKLIEITSTRPAAHQLIASR